MLFDRDNYCMKDLNDRNVHLIARYCAQSACCGYTSDRRKKLRSLEYSVTVVLSQYEMLSSICYCKLVSAL